MLLKIPQLLKAEEVDTLLTLAAQGPFIDGRETAGVLLHDVKHNEQFKATPDQVKMMGGILQQALERDQLLQRFAWPRKVKPPLLSRYAPGMAYGSHYDQPVMGNRDPMRSDMSLTIFLSDPDSYDGGELNLETPFGTHLVKLPPGDGAVYATMMKHQVNPVTRGERLALVTWIQSMIKEPDKRQILFDITSARQALRDAKPDTSSDAQSEAQETADDLLHKTVANLMRLWAEV